MRRYGVGLSSLVVILVLSYTFGVQPDGTNQQAKSNSLAIGEHGQISQTGQLEILHGRVMVWTTGGNGVYMCDKQASWEFPELERFMNTIPRPIVKVNVMFEEHVTHRDCDAIEVTGA